MEIKDLQNIPESFRPGLPRRIILDELKKDQYKWRCHQIPPTKNSPFWIMIFTKREEWNFIDEEEY